MGARRRGAIPAAEWIESGELVLIEENGAKKPRRRRYTVSTAMADSQVPGNQ